MQKEKEKVVHSSNEIICAQATSHSGIGAVAIVRVSGAGSFELVERYARKIDSISPLILKGTHRCRYGLFVDSLGKACDSVLFVYMRGPDSFTGEDVVEIQCHGGLIQPRLIIETLLSSGVRLARCGEFSQRAFLNGRLSLMEAESVNNIVSATTRVGASVALHNSLGLSTGFIKNLRTKVLSLLAQVEVQIDFPEDTEHLEDTTDLIVGRAIDVKSELDKFLKSFDRGIVLQNGLSLVITGPVNSGKSSLFNCLVKSDRAIVNSTAGTTRDTISESVSIDGWNFNILDTAGLRSTDCSIELEGIRRSRDAAKNADIIISLYDLSEGIEDSDDLSDSLVLSVGNKCDLITTNYHKRGNELFVSALTGEGIDDLLVLLVDKAVELSGINDAEGVVMASLRQKNDTLEAVSCLNQAIESLKTSTMDQAADDLRYVSEALSSLLGEIQSSQVIDEIFSSFCLGK
jgi:tRNA modification GTPase